MSAGMDRKEEVKIKWHEGGDVGGRRERERGVWKTIE